jgi:hypothetical protein
MIPKRKQSRRLLEKTRALKEKWKERLGKDWVNLYLQGKRGAKLKSIYEARQKGSQAALIGSDLKDSAAVTPYIKSLAKKLFIKQNKAISIEDRAAEIIKFVSKNIQFKKELINRIYFLYGKISAQDAIFLRKIPVCFFRGIPSFGCGTVTDVTVALMNSIFGQGSAKHVRTINSLGLPHSIVKLIIPFRVNGDKQIHIKTILYDPFQGILNTQHNQTGPVVEQVGEEALKKINILKSQGLWKEGYSLVDFNKSYNDYDLEREEISRRVSKSPEAREILTTRKGII